MRFINTDGMLLALQAGVEREHLPEGSAAAIYNYFGKLGQLTRAGHVDLKNIGGMAGIGLTWWVTLESSSRRMNAMFGASSASKQSDFEWLAGKFAEIAERAGLAITFDGAYVRDSLERRLDMLRVEQSLRAVIVAPPEAMTDATASPEMAPPTAEA